MNTVFFSHPQNRYGQKSAHLASVRISVCTSDLIPLLLTWMEIKVNQNWAATPQDVLRADFGAESVLKLEMKLTSTTTTSTFTFGGKSSSGWKHLTMATSRWIVARRSLLWMTGRRAAENKTQTKQIWQNSPPPSTEAKKAQKDLNLRNRWIPSCFVIDTLMFASKQTLFFLF